MKPSNLVPVQANHELVKHLKILAASKNVKMYELVNGALTEWLMSQQKEFKEIQQLMVSDT